MKQDGHEIGYHGNMHVVSEYYIKENGYISYFEDEIDSGLNLLDSVGLYCESFAYPYGAKYIFTDILLLRKFNFIRGVTPLNKEKDLSEINEIYYTFNGNRSVSSISFDNNSGLTQEMITKALDRAKNNQEVLMLYAHTPTNNNQAGYYFNTDMLEFIIEQAKSRDLKFCTTNDLL